MPPDIEYYSAGEGLQVFTGVLRRGHTNQRYGELHHVDGYNGSAFAQTSDRLSQVRGNGPIGQRRSGAPGAIRTPDPQIRSLMLYPAELRVRGKSPLDAVFQGRKCVARFFCPA